MTKQDYSTDSFTVAANHFNELVMEVVAHRIAVLAQTDRTAAANDYQQHVSVMTVSERADFSKMVVRYGMECAA